MWNTNHLSFFSVETVLRIKYNIEEKKWANDHLIEFHLIEICNNEFGQTPKKLSLDRKFY